MANSETITTLTMMRQACRNIVWVTDNYKWATQIVEDESVRENLYLNFTVLIDAYNNVSLEQRKTYDIIRWKDMRDNLIKISNDLQKNGAKAEASAVYTVCKFLIPILQDKIEKIFKQESIEFKA